MYLPDTPTGPLRWHIERAADPGTDPLVVRPRPAGGLQVIRALRGEEPSASERQRIAEIIERHRRVPLELPVEVSAVRDWVIAIDCAGWKPPHRGAGSDPGYPSAEAAEARVEQLRAIYGRRGVEVPPMRVVAQMRREPPA